tara:strand:+ start:3798 stop:4550 length:753 start_codon:yes stop_codon:yes gene_type:complete
MTRKRYKTLDEKYMGTEPSWEDIDDTMAEYELTAKIESAIRWYSYFYDFKESLKFVDQFYRKQKVDRTNLKKITTMDTMRVGRIVGFLCRMKVRGIPKLSTRYAALLVDQLKIIEDIGKYRQVLKNETQEAPKVISVQERITSRANGLIFDLDYVIELFEDNNFKTSFTWDAFQKLHNIKKPVAAKMVPLIDVRIAEWENKDNEPDLREAYKHVSKRDKNKIIKIWKECKSGCQKIMLTKQPRKKRKKVL